jgi:hypothetical protein
MLNAQTHARRIAMVHRDWCETWVTMWVCVEMQFEPLVELWRNRVAFGHIALELALKTVLASRP